MLIALIQHPKNVIMLIVFREECLLENNVIIGCVDFKTNVYGFLAHL